MLETIQTWLSAAANYFGLGSVIIGCMVGYVLTVMLERYFLPVVHDAQEKRRQRGLTFVFCWLASGTASALLWWALDGEHPVSARVTISYTIGVLSFVAYPVLANHLTAKYPAIGSAWAKPE